MKAGSSTSARTASAIFSSCLVLGSRDDDRLDAGDGALAGAEHRRVVEVAFLHLHGQPEILVRIAAGRLAQDLGETPPA